MRFIKELPGMLSGSVIFVYLFSGLV